MSTTAREVIAKHIRWYILGGDADVREADAIIADLNAAGLEIIDTNVTRPDWKQIAKDMIDLHDLVRRRGYFEAAESLEPSDRAMLGAVK